MKGEVTVGESSPPSEELELGKKCRTVEQDLKKILNKLRVIMHGG